VPGPLQNIWLWPLTLLLVCGLLARGHGRRGKLADSPDAGPS
jgi:hypothetical protein